MLTMEAFHQLLFSSENQIDSYLARLNALTQANLEQMRNLKTGAEWEVWAVKESNSP